MTTCEICTISQGHIKNQVLHGNKNLMHVWPRSIKTTDLKQARLIPLKKPNLHIGFELTSSIKLLWSVLGLIFFNNTTKKS